MEIDTKGYAVDEGEMFIHLRVSDETFNYSTNMPAQDLVFWLETVKNKVIETFVQEKE